MLQPFPYRIDRDSVSRGCGYGTPDILVNRFFSALKELQTAGYLVDDVYSTAGTLVDAWASGPADELETVELAIKFETMLDAHAPAGTYFGTSNGDDTDFGFWTRRSNELERIEQAPGA